PHSAAAGSLSCLQLVLEIAFDRLPTALFDHRQEDDVGAEMALRGEGDRRAAQDADIVLDALEGLQETLGGEILAGLLERHDDEVADAVAKLGRIEGVLV